LGQIDIDGVGAVAIAILQAERHLTGAEGAELGEVG
jgi:hypothetical protein